MSDIPHSPRTSHFVRTEKVDTESDPDVRTKTHFEFGGQYTWSIRESDADSAQPVPLPCCIALVWSPIRNVSQMYVSKL